MIDLLKALGRGILALLIPIVLIVIGGGVAFLGISVDVEFVLYGGLALIGVGAVWLFLLFNGANGGSPFGD
ncbi:MAG: hypothetical protein AAGD13_14645 [Pseudomonadota bacterium]